MCRWRRFRTAAWWCSIVALVIIVCHFFVHVSLHNNLGTDSGADAPSYQNGHDRKVLAYSEPPRVNALCSDARNVFLLVLINSAPNNFYLRWTIRQTWGKLREYNGCSVRLAFVLGRLTDADWRISHLVAKESARTNDIIMGDFLDTYYNLTTKTLFGMNWVREHCSNARYIIKGDDDVLILPHNVIDYLRAMPEEKGEFLYEGACQINHEPIRAEDNKWYISENDYPNSTYPAYQLGVAVIHSYKALDELYKACHQVPDRLSVNITFPFDDVFIGICAHLTPRVEVTCNQHIIVYKDNELRIFVRGRRPNCLMATTLAVHGINRRAVVQNRWNLAVRIGYKKRLENCTFNYTTSAS